MSLDDRPPADEPPAEGADGDEEVEVDAVRQAAVEFVAGLTDAFGFEATVQTRRSTATRSRSASTARRSAC